jgi:hypothetical protein
MLPKLSSCFKSIKPFFDNSKEATKFDEMIDLLIVLLSLIKFGITCKKLVHSVILPKIFFNLFTA